MSSDYSFTDEQKAWMMKLARESVTAAAEGRDLAPPEPDASWKLLHDKGAAFVTLRRRSDGSLRGCIGHIIARVPLYECIAEMGRAAAIHDSRFSPVTPSELGDIHLEISVLTPLQRVEDPEEIVVGKDGVVLKHGYHQGVFLPQVPVEQGWDRTAYLDNLCYKAGMARQGCWKDDQAVLEKFQAIIWEEED
jgi:AmmeMemoRadiSam system protein A